MPSFGNFWRTDGDKRKTKHRPPPKVINVREELYTVFTAPGVAKSPEHKHSTHVYIIFRHYDNMPSDKFTATISFRTMYNDHKGMKNIDLCPASEDADPLYDINGGGMTRVFVDSNTFMVKIGWVKRSEKRDKLYTEVANCLPFPIRGSTMDSEEWEELRAKGKSPRTNWVIKAIGVLKKSDIWESLPESQFRERHNELKKLKDNNLEADIESWIRRVDRARRNYSHDVHKYKSKLERIGPEPEESSQGKQAKYLDDIMNNVGVALYSPREEEFRRDLAQYRRRYR